MHAFLISTLWRPRLLPPQDNFPDFPSPRIPLPPTRTSLLDVGWLLAAEGHDEGNMLPLLCRYFRDDHELFRMLVNLRLGAKQDMTRLHRVCRLPTARCIAQLDRLLAINYLDVNIQTTRCKNSAVHFAILAGRCDIVDRLLAHPQMDLTLKNSKFSGGETPLALAVRTGQSEMASLLLERRSADVINSKDAFGRTPLFFAAGRGNLPLLNLLLETPHIDINALTNARESALSWAVQVGHIEVVAALLARPDCDVNSAIGQHGFTPLQVAVSNEHTPIVELLLQRPDVEVNREPVDAAFAGWTALTFAATSSPIATLLQSHGGV